MIKRDALTNFKMEFSELIKVSAVESVLLHSPFLPVREMSLAITGHHLILGPRGRQLQKVSARGQQEPDEIWVRK